MAASDHPTTHQQLTQNVRDAIDLSKMLSVQLRSLSENGDDREVQDFLAREADAAAGDRDWLLQFSAGEGESSRMGIDLASKLPLSSLLEGTDEEKVLEGLIAAFAAMSTKRALFLGLQQAAMEAGEDGVSQSAATAASAAMRASAEAWHFIPSRSKIAFNVLTAGELNPAIETKAAAPLS